MISHLRSAATASGFALDTYGDVAADPEGAARLPLLRLRLRLPSPSPTLAPSRGEATLAPSLLVLAGFHGEEPAGPLTVPDLLPPLAERARALGVHVTVYPCVNPAGFARGTRYNARGERPNNDALRYETAPGVWRGDLLPGQPLLGWRLHREGPEETRALVAALDAEPAPTAVVDLHQDATIAGGSVYAYVLGDRPAAARMLAAAATAAGSPIHASAPVHGARTDADGLIESHDGSVMDWLFRRGTRLALCPESATDLPLCRALRWHRAWVLGAVEGTGVGRRS